MAISLTIISGRDKRGGKEKFDRIELSSGESVSIVGATGSGKTAMINDVELLAQGDTVTGRTILIDGKYPTDDFRNDPAKKPIVMITQNTKCFTDLTVEDFLLTHARARNKELDGVVDQTIKLANEFTGEKIHARMRVTALSGGQTRSLMIADAIRIGAAPIILLDEVENAGIFKHVVVEAIKKTDKIIIFVTHDPVIALLTDKRIVMRNGAVEKMIEHNTAEMWAAEVLIEIDRKLGSIREELRSGNTISQEFLSVLGFKSPTVSELGVV